MKTVCDIQGVACKDVAAATHGPAAPHGTVDRAAEKVDRVVRRRAGLGNPASNISGDSSRACYRYGIACSRS